MRRTQNRSIWEKHHLRVTGLRRIQLSSNISASWEAATDKKSSEGADRWGLLAGKCLWEALWMMASLTRATSIWKPPLSNTSHYSHWHYGETSLELLPVSLSVISQKDCPRISLGPCPIHLHVKPPAVKTLWDTILKSREEHETPDTYRFRKSSEVRVALPPPSIYMYFWGEGSKWISPSFSSK